MRIDKISQHAPAHRVYSMEAKYASYRPSKADRALIMHIEDRFEKMKRQRTRAYRHIDDISLENFWRDSRDQYNGYVPKEKSETRKWQSRIFRKKTRKKIVASAASLISSGIATDIQALKQDNRFDREFSRVTEMLADWSAEREAQESVLIRCVLEGFATGTGLLYEEIAWESRTIKEIDDIDMETGRITSQPGEFIEFKGPRVSLANVEEVYFGDVFEPEVQRQPDIIRRRTVDYGTAEMTLAKHKNWNKVIPDSHYFLGAERDEKELQEDFDDRVEIVEYWCKTKDQFCTIANGVLLTERDMGFPYPHKKYPFAKFTPFLFADTRFVYGDSLAHISAGEQSVINDFTNLMVDSEKLRNKPPVLTTSREIASSDVVIPGAMIEARQDEKVEIMQAFSQGSSQGLFNAMQVVESQMDENSIDPLVSGTSPEGSPTATEVNAIVGSAERMKGLTEKLFGEMLVQFAHLRIPNLFWFLVNDEEFERIVLGNVKIRGGKTGDRHIIITNTAELPSSEEVLSEEFDAEERGEAIEMVYVNKDKVNDYRFHITVSAQPKPPKNSAGRLQRAYTKYQLYSQNPLIDQRENTRRLVEALGDEPDEMIQEAAPEGMSAEGAPQGTPETVGLPKQNVSLMPQEQSPINL